ncbi:hypothetical protein [Actinophytocola gossypii]|uniref:PilZ domain-containing protein n=1 Tax=Actinophytocola gossypii TaxID=2812003 RepID=A0ABT2J1Q6_9PSEU|nr:hypothetical protein [Actinophytocola gossypii]MCT2581606.1 hypothetical protein [Actinophytocola gossypii]
MTEEVPAMNPAFAVSIGDSCRISSRVSCGAEIDISCDGLTLTFHPDALREVLRHGIAALNEVESRHAAIRTRTT